MCQDLCNRQPISELAQLLTHLGVDKDNKTKGNSTKERVQDIYIYIYFKRKEYKDIQRKGKTTNKTKDNACVLK